MKISRLGERTDEIIPKVLEAGAAVGVFPFIGIVEVSIEGGAYTFVVETDGVEACGYGAALHHLRKKPIYHLRFLYSHLIHQLGCNTCNEAAFRYRKIVRGKL